MMKRIRISVGLILLLATNSCGDQSSSLVSSQNVPMSYWEFSLEGGAVKLGDKSGHSYVAGGQEKPSNSRPFRSFDLQMLQVGYPDGKREALKLLDTLVLSSNTKEEVILVRYIYGMGKFDGLQLAGFSKPSGDFLYALNTTWGAGVIDSAFHQEYLQQGFSPRIFKLQLPPPPPPPPGSL